MYAWAVLGNVPSMVLWASTDPHDLVALNRDDHLHEIVYRVHLGVNVGLTLLVFAAVVDHWRLATWPGRRALAPVVWASGPVLVGVLVLNSIGLSGWFDQLRGVSAWLTPLAITTLPLALGTGLTLSSLHRLRLGRFVVELGEAPPRATLRQARARTLRDPTLTLVYWSPAEATWIDASGHPAAPPDCTADRAVTLLERRGDPVAAILHDPSLESDTGLMESVVAAACLALENERLQAETRVQLNEVRASRTRIVEAADEARRRLERDLHDGAQQRLANVGLTLRLARDSLDAAAQPVAAMNLERAAEELRHAVVELRDLARGLHPAILTEAGLGAALRSLAERSSIPVEVRSMPGVRLPAPIEAAAYFAVSEALTNACKHARASVATVTVTCEDGRLVVDVTDDGVGGADPVGGTGLRGLADRVAAVGGRLECRSPSGGGTRIHVELPCGS